MFRRRLALSALALCALQAAHSAQTQISAGAAEIRATGGLTKIFLGEPAHLTAGGSIRCYLTRRLSVQPGVFLAHGSDYQEWSVLPDLAFDFPTSGGQVTPYVVGGVGWLTCRDKRIDYTSTGATKSLGVLARMIIRGRQLGPVRKQLCQNRTVDKLWRTLQRAGSRLPLADPFPDVSTLVYGRAQPRHECRGGWHECPRHICD